MSKRRKFTPEFKAEQVIAVLTNMKSQADVCREYQIKPQLFNRWKTQFLENAHLVFDSDAGKSEADTRIEELERVLGRKTHELEMAKKASTIWHSQTSKNGRS